MTVNFMSHDKNEQCTGKTEDIKRGKIKKHLQGRKRTQQCVGLTGKRVLSSWKLQIMFPSLCT